MFAHYCMLVLWDIEKLRSRMALDWRMEQSNWNPSWCQRGLCGPNQAVSSGPLLYPWHLSASISEAHNWASLMQVVSTFEGSSPITGARELRTSGLWYVLPWSCILMRVLLRESRIPLHFAKRVQDNLVQTDSSRRATFTQLLRQQLTQLFTRKSARFRSDVRRHSIWNHNRQELMIARAKEERRESDCTRVHRIRRAAFIVARFRFFGSKCLKYDCCDHGFLRFVITKGAYAVRRRHPGTFYSPCFKTLCSYALN